VQVAVDMQTREMQLVSPKAFTDAVAKVVS
jgi:hypothetical protein